MDRSFYILCNEIKNKYKSIAELLVLLRYYQPNERPNRIKTSGTKWGTTDPPPSPCNPATDKRHEFVAIGHLEIKQKKKWKHSGV